MTSPISIRKLLKQEIKQNFWMFALAALVQFLSGPVCYLLSTDISLTNTPNTLYVVQRLCGFFNNNYFIVQLFAMIISIGFCIFSYRYLFSKRMVDLYHSVPITRGKLFWVKYIHGFLVWFLPFIISTVAVLLVSLVRLGYYADFTYAGQLLRTWTGSVILLLFCFFIFYHLFLVAAYLSGNIINLLANVIIMGISVISIYALLLCLAEVCFDTFCQTPSNLIMDLLAALSPLVTPFYIQYYVEDLGFTRLLSGHSFMFLTSLVFSIFLSGMALLLYQRRPSELAERGTINKLYKTPARVATTLLATLGASFFFGQLVASDVRILWSIFGTLLGGIICFGAINSIYHTTIKSFFKNLPLMLGVTGIGTLIVLAFHFDWFGYDSYLPDKEDIAGMAIYMHALGEDTSGVYLNSNSAWGYTGEYLVVTQEHLLTDKEICYSLLELAVNKTSSEDRRYFYAKIELENGRTYYRQYYINYSDYQALAPFVESEDYKHTNYKVSCGLMGYPEAIEVRLQDANIVFRLTTEQVHTLMDAYMADFEEHYSLNSLTSFFYNITLDMDFINEDGDIFYSYQGVPSNYERTLNYLYDLYPEYIPYITSAEQISRLTPHITMSDIRLYGSLRNYYDATSTCSVEINTTMETAPSAYSTNTEIILAEYAEASYAATETEFTFDIEAPELLDELYPLLYFGRYVATFGARDYIYFGEVLTTDGRYMDAWIKPGTLPESYLLMIEEAMAEANQK